MVTCSKCGRENSDTAQFCTACHNTLLFKCPNCWNQQRHAGTCEKCGADMALAWKVQAATAMAAAVKEEGTNVDSSGQNVMSNVRMAEMAVLSPTSFLTWLGLRYAWRWFSKLLAGE